MPLRDHAESLADLGRSWVGFNTMWASHVLTRLNCEHLPPDYRAGLDVHKPQFAFPTFEAVPDHVVPTETADRGFPPAPIQSGVAAVGEPRSTDVTVDYEPCQQLAAVVAFSHPGFTGSTHGRRAFAVKCARWLQRGTSVVAVNVDSPADLHGDLSELLRLPDAFAWRSPTGFSAVAYRVVAIQETLRLEVWPHPLAVGEPLPTVPLWLASDLAIPLDLEATYEAACKSLRIE